jgi:uncharacterized cupredoxin-like copper-binding protein
MKLLQTVVLALLIGMSTAARAHGDETGKKKTAPTATREQMDWGIAGDAKAVKRTIRVRMLDSMRFSPDKIEVRQGETIRFVLRNDGKLMHEMVIGTTKVLDEHAALMQKFPEMEHDEPYMAHVRPGKTGAIVWTFNRAGRFDFACLIAGHYSSGMKGSIVVSPR